MGPRNGLDDAPERATAPPSRLRDRTLPNPVGRACDGISRGLGGGRGASLDRRPSQRRRASRRPRQRPHGRHPRGRRALPAHAAEAALPCDLPRAARADPPWRAGGPGGRVPHGHHERFVVRWLLRGLTATLLALGMMSIGWMVAVGLAIIVEKTTPVGLHASRASAVVLAVGAVMWTI